jgi:hypothetical protein
MHNIRFETFTIKHFPDFERLAYKAVFEKGWVDMDFDRQHWNTHVKNTVSLASNITRCLFDGKELIGFYILQLHNLPWNKNTHAIMTLMHIGPSYRTVELYQAMLRDADAICSANQVKKLQTSTESFLLRDDEKLTLLHNNNFQQIDMVWEVSKNV